MKTNSQPIVVAKLIAILMLLLALGHHPYGYYQILRWIIASVTGYSAYLAYQHGKNAWALLFGIIAVLFNPIAPIYLARTTWSIIDLIVAAIIGISIFKTKIEEKNK